MVVSQAGLSDDAQAETGAHDLLARARVAVLGAQTAGRRAAEAVALSRDGRARARPCRQRPDGCGAVRSTALMRRPVS